jgi:hypothetical protein
MELTSTTRASRKMHIETLRALAWLVGITRGLYGTSKDALVIMIDRVQRETAAAV